MSLTEVLPNLSQEEQYQAGVKAGNSLRELHKVKVTESATDVLSALMLKKQQQLLEYQQSDLRMADDQYLIDYVQQHLHYIKDGTIVLQHGDFHVGNLIYSSNGIIGVTDFDRCNLGCPYEEFYKMQYFSRVISTAFCAGQLEGFFQGLPPKRFWQMQKLYVFHAALFSIYWAKAFGKAEIATMEQHYRMICEDYQKGELLIPKWWTER